MGLTAGSILSHDQVDSAGTFTLNASTEAIIVIWAVQSGGDLAARTLTACTITGGGATLTLSADAFYSGSPNGTGCHVGAGSGFVAAATGGSLPTTAGGCTLNFTFSGTVGTVEADVYQIDTTDTSVIPVAGSGIIQSATANPWDNAASVSAQADSLTFAIEMTHGNSAVARTDPSGFTVDAGTDRAATSWSSTGRVQVAQKATVSATTHSWTPQTAATATRGIAIAVNYTSSSNPDVNTASTAPFEPGETVTFAGTSLNVANSGARIRKVGGTSAYDALTGYSASSAIAATAAIANRPARTPYTSEDGTTHTIEFIATVSGAVSGTPTTAITTNNFVPPTGYSRVTIVTPDLSSASLLSYLGWTSVAGDQIEWDNSVNVSGTDVTILVNSDGTVTADSGSSAMPTSVPFAWRAYSTASEQWTGSASNQSDWATATFGAPSINTAGKVGRSLLDRMRRRRG